jgi:hypothetical protein
VFYANKEGVGPSKRNWFMHSVYYSHEPPVKRQLQCTRAKFPHDQLLSGAPTRRPPHRTPPLPKSISDPVGNSQDAHITYMSTTPQDPHPTQTVSPTKTGRNPHLHAESPVTNYARDNNPEQAEPKQFLLAE